MQFDHILFPIDFSGHTQALASEVAWLAKRFDSHVSLLHVADVPSTCYAATEAYYDWDTYRMLADRIKRQLYNFPMELPAARVARTAIEGEPAQLIVKWAAQNQVDLIVMGTRGCGSVRGLLLGSVAQTVIQQAHCPVWIHSLTHAPARPPDAGFDNVVCALELTEEAVPVLRFTKALAEKTGAKVHLVHSVPKMDVTAERYFSTNLHDYLMEAAAKTIASLQQTAETDFPLTLTG